MNLVQKIDSIIKSIVIPLVFYALLIVSAFFLLFLSSFLKLNSQYKHQRSDKTG